MLISRALLSAVSDWAKESHASFLPNGRGRQYGILQEHNPPAEVWEIKRQIVQANGLQSAEQEPVFRDFCGVIFDGGAIHPHTDQDSNGKQHVRFNVMVSKPVRGGVPIQDGVEVVVEEGEVWRCDASRVRHWCTEVVGAKPRIVLSFGFLL
jgi:hypothetical protein